MKFPPELGQRMDQQRLNREGSIWQMNEQG